MCAPAQIRIYSSREDIISKIDNLIEIHNLSRNNTYILGETQSQAFWTNVIVRKREPIHMLDTAVDGESLLCINESHWAYGTEIPFAKQAGKVKKKKRRQKVSSDRSEKIRTGVFAY